jgi:hypothetical protein
VTSATVVGMIPAIALVVMLRKGAPLQPRLTLMLGALAMAARCADDRQRNHPHGNVCRQVSNQRARCDERCRITAATTAFAELHIMRGTPL